MPSHSIKTSLTATLSVRDWTKAVEFYKSAFVASEEYRVEGGGLVRLSVSGAGCIGVKVGTSVREAWRLCPGITLVKARPKIYVQVCHHIPKSLDKCADVHRIYSIDEWTIPLRGNDRNPEQTRQIV